ncbi:Oidioi.mRNA.OKI2018_I69.chr2.g4198.t1.cds [Oikopleura dioica]|uniref:Oidioi.mRNA.OKI2018_I69.chr2.g4198.t1.cds n=1 Tax=Oikopleura dioica TaxID=34765 RepID=A0ABN7SY64_OIKDI|nr:Oidioi.mRNA.OKI2018_I69.chr2.g4198.t1.cds [Oikopleura dioica]
MEKVKKTREKLKDHDPEPRDFMKTTGSRRPRPGKTTRRKPEVLGDVTVWFGKEEKQIRNLTMRTTVNEVIGALAMDSCEYNASGATLDNRNYVIVESWRGIERPLPPRTKLLKVWKSWKAEQPFVKFYLKKNSSISFRHNQPSKSLRKNTRRKRPNFIGAKETFIDGPVIALLESSAATSGSTTTTTTSSDTFGSSADFSGASNSTTGSSGSSSSSSNSDEEEANQEEIARRGVLGECVAFQEKLDKLTSLESSVSSEIAAIEHALQIISMQDELDDLTEQVGLIDERISSVKHVEAGLNSSISSEKRKGLPKEIELTQEQIERSRIIQTKIEAHLFVNLRLAAESDMLSLEVEQLDSCILTRKLMLEKLAIQSASGSVEELEEQILAYAHNSKHASQKMEHLEVQSTKSQSSDGGNFSESVDLSLSNPQKLAKYESSQFDSDSSLPDSDSAVSSMGASESSLKPLKKPQKPITKMDSKVELKQIRETLV